MATFPVRVGIFTNPGATKPYPNDLRTWTSRSIPLLATTLKPTALGKNYTDLPPLGSKLAYPSATRTWTQGPKQVAPTILPTGQNLYDIHDIPTRAVQFRDRTWIETGNALVVVVNLPPGENYTDRPQPRLRIDYTWIETPQTVVSGGPLPTYDWQLPPSMVGLSVDLGTWIETPQTVPVTVTLPPGENYTDRSQSLRAPVPSWGQFNPNLSQDELPVGENYTERSQLLARIDYTWIETPQTVVITPIGENYTDRPQLLRRIDYTWIETPQTAVPVTLPPGENFSDRPAPISWYREWLLNLQQTTLTPTVALPTGAIYSDRPRPITWSNAWTVNLQETTLTPTVTLPPGKTSAVLPQLISWYREWLLNLQQTTLTPTVTLPTGENYTDRPQPVSWYRDWSQNLLNSTLIPVVYMPASVVEMFNPTPYPRLDQTWTQGPAPQPPVPLPPGENYIDRPAPVYWYREWLLNLQQSTLAPVAIFPPGKIYADRPQPITWSQFWAVNLQEFTPVGPDVLPPGEVSTNLPPPLAPQFSRSWESPYNVNLFVPTPAGPIPVRVGAVGRRRRERERPIDPWSRTLTPQHWKELQELIQAEAAAAEEANRRDDLELEFAAEAAREVIDALYNADETPAINQNVVQLTASLRSGALQRALMEARALTAYLAEQEDDADCELLLFS